MTPDNIAQIRSMRGCGVPWTVISRHHGYSVAECRTALGMPTYDRPTERVVVPWDAPEIRQQRLFDQQ